MEEDDEFETECMALEAIFCDSFRREDGRRICVTVEPTTPEGETLHGTSAHLGSFSSNRILSRVDLLAHT